MPYVRPVFPALLIILACGCSQQETPARPEAVSQQGHAGELSYYVFSDDTEFLLTTWGGYDRHSLTEAILWDAASGAKLRQWRYPENGFPPAFLPNRRLLVGNKVLSLDTGKTQYQVAPDDSYLLARTINSDQSRISLADETGAFRCFDAASGKVLQTWNLNDWRTTGRGKQKTKVLSRFPQNYIFDTHVNSKGELLALISEKAGTPSHETFVSVWNLTTSRELREIEIRYIDGAKFSPDCTYIVTHCWDDTSSSDEDLRIFETATGKKLVHGREHPSGLRVVNFLDNHQCVLGTASESAHVFDLRTQKIVREFPQPAQIRSTKLQARDLLAIKHRDGESWWNVRTGDQVDFQYPKATARVPYDEYDSSLGRKTVSGFHVSSDRWFFLGSNGKDQWLGNAKSGQLTAKVASIRDERHRRLWSPDGRQVISTVDGVVRLFDTSSGKVLQTFAYRSTPGSRYSGPLVAFSENGKYVCTYNQRLSVWDTRTGRPVADNSAQLGGRGAQGSRDNPELGYCDPHEKAYHGTSIISQDHRLAASWGRSSKMKPGIEVWDLNEGRIIHHLAAEHSGPRHTASFSEDLRHFAISDPDGQRLHIWDPRSGKHLSSLNLDEHRFQALSQPGASVFLGDGEHMVYAESGDTLTFAKVTGEVVRQMIDKTPRNKNRPARLRPFMMLSKNQRYIAVDYGTDYTVVWDLESGREAIKIDERTGNVPPWGRLLFSEDSSQILRLGNDCRIWDLTSGEMTDIDDNIFYRQGIRGFVRRRYREEDNLVDYEGELPESIRAQLEFNPLQIRQTQDGKRIIIRDNRRMTSAWNARTHQRIERYYPFQMGAEWLTERGGTFFGATNNVRYRKPGTVELLD